MKLIKTTIIAFTLMGFMGAAHAEDAHQKMDMDQMMKMKHDCMSMHNDNKMCDDEMMEKCQQQMDKKECQKMIKKSKTKK